MTPQTTIRGAFEGALFFFILLLPTALSTRAQARLEVTVVGTDDAPLSGATVSVENEEIGFTTQAQTNAQGKARFASLSTSGRYDVFVPEADDYYEARADDLRLRSGATRSIALLLIPFDTVELDEVEVTANRRSFAEIDRTSAEVASTLSEAEVELLPVEGRDLTRALYRLPNVTQATGFYPEAPTVSINGANSLYTNYLIDGMDNNENFLGGQKFNTPTGIVQDVTVLTSNYSVEYGRTGNGIFNVTTRSGSNTSSGEGFYLTRPGPVIDASTDFATRDLSGNQVDEGFQRYQFGGSLGGPIVEDKTFFYVNAEQTIDLKDNLLTAPQLGVTTTVPGTNAFTYLTGKIDHRWSNHFRSSLRANVSRVAIDFQGGGLDGGVTFPSASYKQDRNAALVALQNTYTAGRLAYEGNVQYSRFRWNYGEGSNRDSPQTTLLGADGVPVAIVGNPGFIFDDLENTIDVQQKLTYTLGDQVLKVGGEFITSDFQLEGGGNANGNYTVQLTGAQENEIAQQGVGDDLGIDDVPSDVQVLDYGVELRPATFGTRQNQVALYAEDQVSVTPKLNVTLGLRWDYDNLTALGGASGDFNNVAPRANFNYSLDEQSVIRGGYGIFYDKILYAIVSDALQQNSTAQGYRAQLQALIDLGRLPEDTDLDAVTFDGNLTANVSGVDYLEGPTAADLQGQRENIFSNERRILNPGGYDNPYTHQFSLGYQRQFDQEHLFYVDLVHTRSYNLFRLKDLNAPAPFDITREQVEKADDPAALVRSQLEADQTRPVNIFQRDAQGDILFDDEGHPRYLPGGARSIIVTETAGASRYYAASVNFVKDRGDDAYAYRLSYTLSRLRNNTEDINFRAEDANDFSGEWGPSINDRTHSISAIGYLYPVENLSLSVAALLQSGQPINRIPDASVFGTTDLNGDGRSFGTQYVGNSDRSPGEPRNGDRLPWSTTFDVSVEYTPPILGNRVELRADVFNLFNTENLSGYFNNATQSNQIQTGPERSGRFVQRNASPPRQFQFGVRYLF